MKKATSLNIKINEANLRIKQSTVHVANLQQVVESIQTHLAALDNASKYVEDETAKKVIAGLRNSFIDTLELHGVELR